MFKQSSIFSETVKLLVKFYFISIIIFLKTGPHVVALSWLQIQRDPSVSVLSEVLLSEVLR